nr:hypothetical protein HK105_004026 [Polyrhizophydium stewartii]
MAQADGGAVIHSDTEPSGSAPDAVVPVGQGGRGANEWQDAAARFVAATAAAGDASAVVTPAGTHPMQGGPRPSLSVSAARSVQRPDDALRQHHQQQLDRQQHGLVHQNAWGSVWQPQQSVAAGGGVSHTASAAASDPAPSAAVSVSQPRGSGATARAAVHTASAALSVFSTPPFPHAAAAAQSPFATVTAPRVMPPTATSSLSMPPGLGDLAPCAGLGAAASRQPSLAVAPPTASDQAKPPAAIAAPGAAHAETEPLQAFWTPLHGAATTLAPSVLTVASASQSLSTTQIHASFLAQPQVQSTPTRAAPHAIPASPLRTVSALFSEQDRPSATLPEQAAPRHVTRNILLIGFGHGVPLLELFQKLQVNGDIRHVLRPDSLENTTVVMYKSLANAARFFQVVSSSGILGPEHVQFVSSGQLAQILSPTRNPEAWPMLINQGRVRVSGMSSAWRDLATLRPFFDAFGAVLSIGEIPHSPGSLFSCVVEFDSTDEAAAAVRNLGCSSLHGPDVRASFHVTAEEDLLLAKWRTFAGASSGTPVGVASADSICGDQTKRGVSGLDTAELIVLAKQISHRIPPECITGVSIEDIASGRERRRTVMIRNIPNKFTQQMFIDLLNETHKCNVGYAFVNFTSAEAVVRFADRFVGRVWGRFKSEKICGMGFATIQGRQALIEKFRNSSVMLENDEYKPKIFYTDEQPRGRKRCCIDAGADIDIVYTLLRATQKP